MATADTQRDQLVQLAEGRCEYCQCPERFSSTTFSIEHIVPRAKGGSDAFDNLAFACQGCNNRKYTATTGRDPLTNQEVALYHPRQQRWAEHFQWSEDSREIIGISAIGRATVIRLALNRAGIVGLRELLIRSGLHPPTIPSPP